MILPHIFSFVSFMLLLIQLMINLFYQIFESTLFKRSSNGRNIDVSYSTHMLLLFYFNNYYWLYTCRSNKCIKKL